MQRESSGLDRIPAADYSLPMTDSPIDSAPPAIPMAVGRASRHRDHRGFLLLIAIGMFHSWIRYFRFGISIFELAEPADFLLAPFRDPLVIVATVAPIGISWGRR